MQLIMNTGLNLSYFRIVVCSDNEYRQLLLIINNVIVDKTEQTIKIVL